MCIYFYTCYPNKLEEKLSKSVFGLKKNEFTFSIKLLKYA